MNYFEFDAKAKILSGEGALTRVKFELDLRNLTKPFILSDRSLEKLGITKTAINDIKPVEFATFFDIPVDSSTETVNSAAKIYKENNCDCIIAIGGGSVIDTAKGVVLSLVSGAEELQQIEGVDIVKKNNNVFFVAVPTTAGTGSEMTSVAVIKDAKCGTKLEYISSFILPDLSVLDPKMTMSLPPRITASTALDALTHAIEAYTCMQKNPISDGFAIEAVKLIFENLPKVIENPKDLSGRMALANAATIAGMAFSNSMVGAVHSIGHSLGAVCMVAHGDAMAILLPFVMRLTNNEEYKKYCGELLMFVNPLAYAKIQAENRCEEFINEVEKLISFCKEKTGLPTKLSETGKVNKENFDLIIEKAINDGSAIVNRVPLTRERILEILEKAF